MPHTFSPAQLHAMKTPFIKWQVGHISFCAATNLSSLWTF